MTKKEFIESAGRAQKAELKLATGAIVALGLFIGLFCAIGIFIRDFDVESKPHNISMGIFVFAGLGFFIWVLSYTKKEAKQAIQVHCPHCEKALTGSASQIAVASGHCGYCGESVYDKEDNEPKES